MADLQKKLKQEKTLPKDEKESLKEGIRTLQLKLLEHQISVPSWLGSNYATDTGLPSGPTGPQGVTLEIPEDILKQIETIPYSSPNMAEDVRTAR